MAGLARGVAIAFGAILGVAGALKLGHLSLTRQSLNRLGPVRRPPNRAALTVVALALAGGELVLGALLVARPTSLGAAVASTALGAGFVAAVVVARRRGFACGCFSTLSTRVAGPVELGRALTMLALGLLMLLAVVVAPDGSTATVPTTAIGAVLAVAALLVVRKATEPALTVRSALDSLRSPAPKPPYRRASRRERVQVLRAARAAPAVRDVEGRAPAPLRWRKALVAVSGAPMTVASISVPGPGCRLQVILPTRGVPAVVCTTPDGVILPSPSVPSATSR